MTRILSQIIRMVMNIKVVKNKVTTRSKVLFTKKNMTRELLNMNIFKLAIILVTTISNALFVECYGMFQGKNCELNVPRFDSLPKDLSIG